MASPGDELCLAHQSKIDEIEKKQIIIGEDIKHIKSRIDNGISGTITKIWDKVNGMTETKVLVKDHEFWISKFKWAVIWIAIVGVGGGAVGVALALIKKGL